MEIEVERDWVVKVAPVLKLGLFILKTAAATYGLPFPIPNLPELGLAPPLSVMKKFIGSFLDGEAQKVVDSCEAAITAITEGTITHTGIPWVRSLTGPAYVTIAEKANKPERSQWKESMTPVMNDSGHWIWVKNKYKDSYA
jgi:hypothetical protein